MTFGTEGIHQIHEIIEYHIFIWNCRSFEHNKHSVSSFSYQFSFSTLTELAQTNVTTKLLSKAAISNEYMIFYHFMILVDIIHSKRQKSYLYNVDDLLLIKEDAYSFRKWIWYPLIKGILFWPFEAPSKRKDDTNGISF